MLYRRRINSLFVYFLLTVIMRNITGSLEGLELMRGDRWGGAVGERNTERRIKGATSRTVMTSSEAVAHS